MPFSRPTLTALQTQSLNDIAAALPTGTPLHNSILRILAVTQAGFAHSHYGYLDWIAHQSVPFTAEGEFLVAWAALKGVYRTPASFAEGTATFTGLAGTVIPQGTAMKRGDGVVYVSTAQATVGVDETVQVAIQAVEAGSTGNASAGITLVLSSPIAGLQSAATVVSVITGGTDEEEDDSLRTRMNQKYAAPPQGGSASDYVTWALSVPGVTRAWCLPNGGGPGSVTVFAMMDAAQVANDGFPQGSNGVAALETRDIAATGDQLNIADYIYPLRPATALVYVAAPQPSPVDFTLANLSPSTTATQDAIKAALKDLFTRQGTPLGTTIYPNDINAAIESVPGIERFTLVTPVTPITTAVGYIPTLGTFSVI